MVEVAFFIECYFFPGIGVVQLSVFFLRADLPVLAYIPGIAVVLAGIVLPPVVISCLVCGIFVLQFRV